MFDAAGDNVPAVLLTSFANATKRQIVRLSAARSENDLVRPGVNERRHLTPGTIDSRPRVLAKLVNTRGVAEFIAQVRQHSLDYAVVDWRGSAVIEVNAQLTSVLWHLSRWMAVSPLWLIVLAF